jgi:hypothetical protein
MAANLSKVADYINTSLKTLPGKPRSPKAKLVFHEISAEDAKIALQNYEERPKHPRSELSQRLESLQVNGPGVKLVGSTLASIKSSTSKFAKTAGRTYRVFPGGTDGEIIVLRTE